MNFLILILFLAICASAQRAVSKNIDLNTRRHLVNFMRKEYPDTEFISAFDLKNLKSYRTYKTKCGNFYSIEATDFSDSRAYGYCGSAGCDNFFFRQTEKGIKLLFHTYLEKIEAKAVDLKPNDPNCLILKIWVSGSESKNLKRAGQDWLDGQIQFKKIKPS